MSLRGTKEEGGVNMLELGDKNSEEYIRNIIEISPTGITTIDEKGSIILINPSAAEMIGVGPNPGGKNLLDIPLVVQNGFARQLEEALKGRKEFHSDLWYFSPKGKRHLHFCGSPLSAGMLITVQDRTGPS